MGKKKAVFAQTAIDNIFIKSIIAQFALAYGQPAIKEDIYWGLSNYNTMINKDASQWLAENSGRKAKLPETTHAKKVSTSIFGRRTKTTLFASNYILRKVTENLLNIVHPANTKNQPEKIIFSDDKITLWLSERGNSVSSPSWETLQKWESEKRVWMVSLNLIFSAYAVASTNSDRSFSLTLSEISGLCGLKSIKRREERLKKIIEGVRLISRLSYTLNWPGKGKIDGFNIQPDLLWKTEIIEVAEDGGIVDYEIKVTPGLWAKKFLSHGESYLQYTTIAEESFNVITEFWQKRPDIVKLMCSVMYLKRINENKNDGALTIRVERLIEVICEPEQVDKLLSGDSRQRRRFITNLYSALETLSESLGWRWNITNDFYSTEDKVSEEYNISNESEGLLLLLANATTQRRLTGDDLTDLLKSKLLFYFDTEPRIKKEKTASVINYFKAFRKEMGLTQRDTASRLGISLSYYKKMENGEREPTDSLIRKMKRIMKSKK